MRGQEAAEGTESPWVGRIGRAGLVAKGILYSVLGILAAQVALGRPSEEPSQEGAINAVAQQPFGKLLLGVLAAGLAAYAAWRLAQAWLDLSTHGGPFGVVIRVSFVVRAAFYAALCALTIDELLGATAARDVERSLTTQLMRTSVGPWIVGGVGVVLLGAGLYQLTRVQPSRNSRELHEEQMTRAQLRWGTRAGVVGHGARAVVFGLVGLFLVRVSVRAASEEAVGLDAALSSITQATHGTLALMAVAVGLVAYGLWCAVLARWGRVRRAS